MYKLLIVEDEKAIAQGIAKSNPWEEWGFQVVEICDNGEDAVAFIEQNRPDLVLSDIRMPKMDGIALMQYLNAQYPEIKIVILSGYNDFEYLQMAIRNHVAEYLLKPTLLEEFEELFRKMKIRLKIKRVGDRLEMKLIDNGVGITKERLAQVRRKIRGEETAQEERPIELQRSSGIGLNNVAARIRLYFGIEEPVKIHSIYQAGTMIVVQVPVLTKGDLDEKGEYQLQNDKKNQ